MEYENGLRKLQIVSNVGSEAGMRINWENCSLYYKGEFRRTYNGK